MREQRTTQPSAARRLRFAGWTTESESIRNATFSVWRNPWWPRWEKRRYTQDACPRTRPHTYASVMSAGAMGGGGGGGIEHNVLIKHTSEGP
jgi:hypothetical protein